MVCASKRWHTVFSFLGEPLKNQIEYFKSNNGEWFSLLENSLSNGKEIEYRCVVSNTTINKHILWSFTPFLTEKDLVIGVIITANDVSTVIEKENLIAKLNSLLETNSELSKVGTWEYDLERNKLSWSKMTKKIYEVPQDYEANVDTAIDFYKLGHSRNKISMLMHKVLQTGEKFQEHLQIVTHKGKHRWVIASGKPLFKDGKIIKILGTLQDVEEQVAAQTKIKESEQLLNTLVDSLPLNVYIKDLNSRKILANKSECAFLGVENSNDVIGKTISDFYDPHTAQLLRNEDLHIIKTKTSIIAQEELVQKKDGTKVPLLVSKIPLTDSKDETYGILGISMDISVLKQKENELKHLIDVTSVQNKKLANFAHIVSHNLRSHSANFSMLLGFLKDERDEVEKNRILKMLSDASDDLLVVLDNLNKVVEINTHTNVTREHVIIKKYFLNAKKSLASELKKNDIKISINIPEDLSIYGIPSYFDNIVLNFLTNAIKYRQPNKKLNIVVNGKKEFGKIVFSIQDNGVGINLNKNGDRLFGMYKTFHNNNDARGIGLYIAKNQIEAMGGNIIVCSELNKGTTFKVYFNERY